MSDKRVVEVESAESFPEHAALYNHIVDGAYGMRLERRVALVCREKLPSYDPLTSKLFPIMEYDTQSDVCNAFLIRAFKFRIGDGVDERRAKLLWDAKLSLFIDHQPVTGRIPLRELIGMKEFPLIHSMGQKIALFPALQLLPTGEADRNAPIGYMLPNGSKIHAELSDLADGVEGAEVSLSWSMGLYTTKS